MVTHDDATVRTDEELYRRFSSEWWSSAKNRHKPLPMSFFMPRAWVSEEKPGDVDGLSVSRVSISSVEVASTTLRGRRLCLAKFPVRIVLERGLSVQPKPTDHDPGHAVIPELNSIDRRDPTQEAIMEEHAMAFLKVADVVWTPDADRGSPG